MSRIPQIEKSKYNKDKAFSWVDSQWEKFMIEQKELKEEITKKQNIIEEAVRMLNEYNMWDLQSTRYCIDKAKRFLQDNMK